MTATALLIGEPTAGTDGATTADRLRSQLQSLGVDAVEPVAADVAAIAAAVRAAAPGPLVLASADVYTQREALAGVLADPRLGTAVLSSRGDRGPGSFALRSERGRAVAAASAYHTVTGPTEWFLGVAKVEDADRAALLAAADRLAGLRLGGDPLALLLVGLVRAGVHVGQSDLRALFWARPGDAVALAQADRDVAGHDEERVLMDSSVKAIDGFFTTFFVSPYSKHIARWAAHRGLTPNQVTTFSMLLGLLAAAAFASGERWGLVAGAVLLQAAFTFDCVDGQLARFTRTFTPLGAWLDSTFDRLKEWLVYAGLAIGAARAGVEVWALAGAALTLQTVRHAFDFSFAAAEHRSMDAAPQRPLDDPSDGAPAGAAAPAAAAEQALGLWRRLDRTPGLIWVKRIVALPIGERFALISLTAALWSPRTTFVALLAWGAFAAVYGLAGRVLRALLRPPREERGLPKAPNTLLRSPSEGGALLAYRDDGPIAALLGRVRHRITPSLLTLVGLIPLGVAIAAGWGSTAATAAVLAWLVALGGLARGGPLDRDRLKWAVPALLRAGEYAALIWLWPPAALAVLIALALRHYDIVYALRYTGAAPSTPSGGWDGRLVLAWILLAAGALPVGFSVLGGILGALFVAESVGDRFT